MTRIRMSRMQGRPPHCSVFTVIRSIKSATGLKIGLSGKEIKHESKPDNTTSPSTELHALEHQQSDRNEGQHIHHRMNIAAAAGHKIQSDVRDETPQNSLGDREG